MSIDLNLIRINPDNPRQINEEKFERLKKSVEAFPKMLELRPIVVDESGMILGGNMRYRAILALGWELKEEWFRVADSLNDDERKRFIIEDNLAFGDWDLDKLANEWTDLPLKDWGLDVFNYLEVDNKKANELWNEMPEFEPGGEKSFQDLIIHFQDPIAVDEFSDMVKQKITADTKYIYFPAKKKRQLERYWIKSSQEHKPKYPIYVISKGRWESRLTVRSLEEIGVDFKVVIEPQEYDNYSAVIDKAKILVLPFSNLGQGSIPARNWVWEHAKESGAKRHWILDDNIRNFYRSYKTVRIKVMDGTIFRCCEDFVDRFDNVPMAGMNYSMFGYNRQAPFTPNTRVYSCILLDNSKPHRWRGRYNEDTDLSLRFLKDGFCTILFNAFLCGKQQTMKMKGGNTDQLYQQNEKVDGRLLMAQSLVAQHPDVTTISRKWGRWQHQVDYSPFAKNKYKLMEEYVMEEKRINEYGMSLYKDGLPLELNQVAKRDII